MFKKAYFDMDDCMEQRDTSYFKLAHAYVPFQEVDEIYSPSEALCKGTLFPQLFMPYKHER